MAQNSDMNEQYPYAPQNSPFTMPNAAQPPHLDTQEEPVQQAAYGEQPNAGDAQSWQAQGQPRVMPVQDCPTKYCQYCGSVIAADAVVCPACGRQVAQFYTQENTQTVYNVNNYGYTGARMCNKWISLLLCFLLGVVGAHKFYEHKIGMGILYLFTGGLFGIGWLVDCILYLLKPETYYLP